MPGTTPIPLITAAYAMDEHTGFVSMCLTDPERVLEFINLEEEFDHSPFNSQIGKIDGATHECIRSILEEAEELTKVKFKLLRIPYSSSVAEIVEDDNRQAVGDVEVFAVDAPDENAYKNLISFLNVISDHFKKLDLEQAADILSSSDLKKYIRNVYTKHYLNKKKRKM